MTTTDAGTALWDPVAGTALAETLGRSGLEPREQARTEAETLRILSRTQPPEWGRVGSDAELVVGAVQSGKTLSFTALIAAARDNGFPLVVVLAGTKRNLRDQTYTRLIKDLGMEGDGGLLPWYPLNGPARHHVDDVVAKVERWRRQPPPAHRVTTVGVVLKTAASLAKAREFMAQVTAKVGPLPVLFVDDEADQAGLNVSPREGEESATYRAIRRVRAEAPCHSYVLYTATPQAPLLISLTDALSPRTVSVLQPGDGYVGGETLFVERRRDFVRLIGDDTALDARSVRPPLSLEQALATFLLAMLVAQRRGHPRPLSMLVHPSSGTDLHSTYSGWVRAILQRISTALLDGDPVLRDQVREEVFARPYADLESTGGVVVGGVPAALDTLMDDLEDYLPELQVRVVNSADGREIAPDEWKRHPGWIVIGGNKLDRGFTVENLAITYMPRGPGVRNADTVQQRGRFFGYKAQYLDLLRAWLNPETLEVYTAYVDHERAMRSDLEALDREGTPLSEWRRSILLDPAINPTRRQVITLAHDNVLLRAGWVLTQTHVYAPDVGPTRAGQDVLDDLLAGAESDHRDHRREVARNRLARTTWSTLAPVLADWGAASPEKDRLYALLLAIRAADGDETPVDLVEMNGGLPRERGLSAASAAWLDGTRKVTELDDPEVLEIANLMQGPDPADGSVYPGDRGFRSERSITVQVHRLTLPVRGETLGATALAINIPPGMENRVILQRRS